ncbi:hypothetical protein QBC47DRAFT_458132 [Echria macrotheca]|uniref:Uncharacterized protein n=1 Tax=Echria macrotheca TaxID=438768 RepID=A0AAJ0BKI7_9PEZI|nr:hypothetical protein QBC47DRAFT_458132 [Echria macrotheca]
MHLVGSTCFVDFDKTISTADGDFTWQAFKNEIEPIPIFKVRMWPSSLTKQSALWRNGSAFDSRSKGYPFKSGGGQVSIFCSVPMTAYPGEWHVFHILFLFTQPSHGTNNDPGDLSPGEPAACCRLSTSTSVAAISCVAAGPERITSVTSSAPGAVPLTQPGCEEGSEYPRCEWFGGGGGGGNGICSWRVGAYLVVVLGELDTIERTGEGVGGEGPSDEEDGNVSGKHSCLGFGLTIGVKDGKLFVEVPLCNVFGVN